MNGDADDILVLRHRDPYVRPGSSAPAFSCHLRRVVIETGEVIEGELPRAAARLVKEWALARQAQLSENWRRARAGEQPERIAGLDVD
jgi:hypothetical protein